MIDAYLNSDFFLFRILLIGIGSKVETKLQREGEVLLLELISEDGFYFIVE